MKKVSLLKKIALCTGALLCATTMSARDIFVSANGSLSNPGTYDSPILFVQGVADNANNGDRIIVLGEIKLEETINFTNKSITITGNNALNKPNQESSASSLDGSDAGRIFNISGSGEVTISNLTLKNAKNKAIEINGTDGALTVNIGYCLIRNNSSLAPSQDGPDNGAGVCVTGGAVVNIFSCWFYENQAFRGGALFVAGSFVDVQYCDFERNFTNAPLAEANSRGGAVACAGAYTLEFNYCGFNGNYSRRGGGCIFEYGEGEFTVKNSYFINNHSGHDWFLEIVLDVNGEDIGSHSAPGDNHAGLLKTDGRSVITFINTTITKNAAYDDAIGGVAWIEGSASGEFNLINCTVTDNMTNGNQDHTGGILVAANFSGSVKIYNSIIDRNKAAGGSFWSDFAGNSTAATYEIKNSIIGAYRNASTADMDDVSIPHYGNTGSETVDDRHYNESPDDLLNASKVGIFYLNAVPLLPDAEKVGNFDYLAVLDIDTDQNNNPIVPEDGKIYAGALQFKGTQNEAESFINWVLPTEKSTIYHAYNEEGSGIYDVAADGSGAVAVGYYNMLGQKLNQAPEKGLFIVKYSNGTSAKILVR